MFFLSVKHMTPQCQVYSELHAQVWISAADWLRSRTVEHPPGFCAAVTSVGLSPRGPGPQWPWTEVAHVGLIYFLLQKHHCLKRVTTQLASFPVVEDFHALDFTIKCREGGLGPSPVPWTWSHRRLCGWWWSMLTCTNFFPRSLTVCSISALRGSFPPFHSFVSLENATVVEQRSAGGRQERLHELPVVI